MNRNIGPDSVESNEYIGWQRYNTAFARSLIFVSLSQAFMRHEIERHLLDNYSGPVMRGADIANRRITTFPRALTTAEEETEALELD